MDVLSTLDPHWDKDELVSKDTDDYEDEAQLDFASSLNPWSDFFCLHLCGGGGLFLLDERPGSEEYSSTFAKILIDLSGDPRKLRSPRRDLRLRSSFALPLSLLELALAKAVKYRFTYRLWRMSTLFAEWMNERSLWNELMHDEEACK